ncbi:MAG TPA: DUF481 domain-containing protein [Turneriella sp.]|nr:DUF481 domain-containing protein [Turneriella sp.]HNL53733.1 DUF481 domain-containing protein [Turneriella sp.]
MELRFNILAAVLLVTPLSAQIFNVEKVRLDHPEDRVIFGNIGANFTYHNRSANLQTPVRVFNGGLTSDVGYASDSHLYLLINNYQVLNVNDSYVVNFGSTHFRTQFFHRNTLSVESYAQYQYDQARGLELRLLAGAGPRWRIIKTPAWNLATGTSLMYEGEDWQNPAIAGDPILQARYVKSSTYISTRYVVNPQVDVNAVTYYQVGYDREFDATLHRVSGEANLAVQLFGNLSFTTSFTAAWESRPIVPIVPFIFMVTNGVRYRF